MDRTRRGIEEQIKDFAFDLGFSHAGICGVPANGRVPFFEEWLSSDYHGRMKYMENSRRYSIKAVLEGVRTVLVVAMNYRWPEGLDKEQEGMISKYAWGEDYHRVMKPKVRQLADRLEDLVAGSKTKVYVDTGPVSEKYWAQRAGVGWIGKHTNVISRKGSSWIFLGVVLSTAELQPDLPAPDHCGTCTRCIEVCPTRAIVRPYVLDARLCISYLTIELRGSIPRELRKGIGHRIFGCDDCQDVCPWNRFAYAGNPEFAPRPEIFTTSLRDYLGMSPEKFQFRFAGTNVLRPGYKGFLRNCLVAAGNSMNPELKVEIAKHLHSKDETIREHAVWAFSQFPGDDTRQALVQLLRREASETVRAEIELCLQECQSAETL